MSVDRLRAATEATRYQKKWFLDVARRAREGEPIAFVNADAPHEILRALDIPYVVTQWWSSIIAAKRMSPAALERVAAAGLPDFSVQYDAIPLGEQDLPADDRPWGGLPQPTFAIAERSGDVTQKIFEQWGERDGTETFLLSRTGADPAPPRWWELVPRRWEEAFGSARIDLLEDEIGELTAWLEERTGRVLDRGRLARILDLGNEQAEWNRRTRDLIAEARPTPVTVNDTMPAVMVPQWHRGSEWAVGAARSLYENVAERVERGDAVCRDEKLRLMWVGRGLWSDLDMYRRFQDEFGAVFVWSMYLAIAADGYARYGDDPMRTLAARFVGITDQLYVPPWSNEWYVKEALAHGVDGVVHLVADDTPGAGLISEALEKEGIPVLEIRANNADQRSSSAARIPERITDFLRTRVSARG
ncbi:2-hydroxyacyl-CoA dehydratase family protein [Paramicrobacterium fandaimingii]|uniref:2-hydroxyacyl-CoA dehydratase family protein n=1 Tax=Paramicrobacterium fandaimingii TaxID=2708079 RepID=UPI0014211EED|nr:2-hydroxyacyl-CoA dehydratase family protein [Microbacterium fandaimingii]